MHEAQFHKLNCFVTLTYRDDPGTLDRTAFSRFMRRLRDSHRGLRIKYFSCGEYGAQLQRPHYHGLIFGFDFGDKRPWGKTRSGHDHWRSAELEKLWPFGYSTIGPVTFETAAYTARYCTKKINGEMAAKHYDGREPEFMTCSKGIGEAWFRKYYSETYRDDSIVAQGHEQRPPRYYDKKMAELDPEKWRQVELDRIAKGNTAKVKWNRTPERLKVRETVKLSQMATQTSRNYEKDQ